ncbi:MAG: hypothetical protein M3Q96_01090 [Pseudomonadota bacterium]|nr:hypothetical protein [Pseudomonadota bacterium]
MNTNPLRALALLALSLCAFAAIAGPPLLCHPFDTAGAPTLAWGGPRWNQPRADYDLRTLSANTEALLKADTPVIARMETLRRAAIYASRDGAIARQMLSRLDARITRAATPLSQSLARFDSGYFTETLDEVVRLQGYDMPGIGKADTDGLRALLATRDGDAQVDAAIKLRPNDAAMRFAAALIASADQRKTAYATHARIARAGAANDRLVARNLQQIANDY